MKIVSLAAIAASAVALSACGTLTSHDSVKVNGIMLNMNANTGVSAGQIGVTVDRTPLSLPAGNTALTSSACGNADAVSTFANMNNKGTATASSVPGSSATAGAISSPAVGLSTADVTANGCAAIEAAAAYSAHPADVIAAALNHTVLPSATASSIVRDGVAPSPAAGTAAPTTPAK